MSDDEAIVEKKYFPEPSELTPEGKEAVFTPESSEYTPPIISEEPPIIEPRSQAQRSGTPFGSDYSDYEPEQEYEETPWKRHTREPEFTEVPLKTMREKIHEWGETEYTPGPVAKSVHSHASTLFQHARERAQKSGLTDKEYEMKMRKLAVEEKRARVKIIRESARNVASRRQVRYFGRPSGQAMGFAPRRRPSVYTMTDEDYSQGFTEPKHHQAYHFRRNPQKNRSSFRPREFPVYYGIRPGVQIPKTGISTRKFRTQIYPKPIDTSYRPPDFATAPFKKRYGINIKKGEPFQPHWIGFNWQAQTERPMPHVNFRRRR